MAGFVKISEASSQNLVVPMGRGEQVFASHRLSTLAYDRYQYLVITPDLCEFRHIPAKRSFSMPISDREMWTAACLIVKRYGTDAEIEAARRADLMLDRGDIDGRLVWFRIRRAVAEFLAAPSGKPN